LKRLSHKNNHLSGSDPVKFR